MICGMLKQRYCCCLMVAAGRAVEQRVPVRNWAVYICPMHEEKLHDARVAQHGCQVQCRVAESVGIVGIGTVG
eukprot:m.35855 g.35855  ORF g.35855 m.35855 type:complete len:73 (-) comp5743_c0_seq2:381-599(-)